MYTCEMCNRTTEQAIYVLSPSGKPSYISCYSCYEKMWDFRLRLWGGKQNASKTDNADNADDTNV